MKNLLDHHRWIMEGALQCLEECEITKRISATKEDCGPERSRFGGKLGQPRHLRLACVE